MGVMDLMEGMDDQAAAAPAVMEKNHREVCVPVAALAMPDEQEQMTEPEVGDVVTLQCDGKVSRIEGDKAYVTLDSVNGENLDDKEEAMAEKAVEEPLPDELASLEEEARAIGY